MEATASIDESSAPPASGRRHGLSRALPLVFTLVSLCAVATANSVWLPLRVQAAGHAFVNLIGQDVRWNMFSADPRGVDLDIWATIEYTDGTTSTWTIDRGVVGGDLQYYRFVQWAETAVLVAPEDALTGLAAWLATTSLQPVARVIIFGSERDPGTPGAARPPARTEVLFDINGPALQGLVDRNG